MPSFVIWLGQGNSSSTYKQSYLLRIDTAQHEDAGQVFRQAMLKLGRPEPQDS